MTIIKTVFETNVCKGARQVAFTLALLTANTAQAQDFDQFDACIGPELEKRAVYQSLLSCSLSSGQPCDAEKLINYSSASYSAVRNSCAFDEIDRCVMSDQVNVCLENFKQTLQNLRQGVVNNLDADLVERVAPNLDNLTQKPRQEQLERLHGLFDGLYNQELCKSYTHLEEGIGISPNLFCDTFFALIAWSTAEDFRDRIIMEEKKGLQ
ncbi:hypothetical protein [Pseudaestuariivita rosea]|uniref:hypothetical protein n=1 Tax=Pseudaestuariivita rosea TaxID=2763263 RepID=UPI001ABAFED3|nr:hypothetical protein [Pseudaestuariivita rosea]